jgi:hypothetical protein
LIRQLYRDHAPAGLRIYRGALKAYLAQTLHRWPRPPLGESLADFSRRWPIPDCSDEPIFVLSAGWRSGSTALQRAINSDESVLIWGEPFNETSTIQRLAESLTSFHERLGRFHNHIIDEVRGDDPLPEVLGRWTAILGPHPANLIEGHRALFRATFAEPAKNVGRPRWGIKEVRLDADHATYLSLLFPAARFVVLVRDPLDAYISYRSLMVRPWYDRWPTRRICGPRSFGEQWARLAGGLREFASLNDALLLRYEDLHDPLTIDRLEKHLGIRVREGILSKSVGSSKSSWLFSAKVPAWEARRLRSATASVATLFGYADDP